jgi:hypothetical protein
MAGKRLPRVGIYSSEGIMQRQGQFFLHQIRGWVPRNSERSPIPAFVTVIIIGKGAKAILGIGDLASISSSLLFELHLTSVS